MSVIWQHVSDPALFVRGRQFVGPVEITGSPIYGRVLFRSHDVWIDRCVFTSNEKALTLSGPIHGAMLTNNVFQSHSASRWNAIAPMLFHNWTRAVAASPPPRGEQK